MQREFLALVTVLVVLLAGCQAPVGGDSDTTPTSGVVPTGPTETPSASPTTTSTPDPTSTPIPSPTPTPTPSPTPTPVPVDPANPYGSEELAVYVDDSMMDRDVGPMLNSSFAYWEEHSEKYAGYPVEYQLVETPGAADIHITFKHVSVCGFHMPQDGVYYGCADVVEPYSTAPTPVNVDIHYNLSNPEIELTLIHELGHTLGLDHDDEPQEYMADPLPVTTLDPVKVHLRASQGDVPFGVKPDVEDGLNYFSDHDDLADSETLDWEFTEDIDEAKFVITYHRSAGECGHAHGGSCVDFGYEYYDQDHIHLTNLDDTIAWHVAFQVSPYFWSENEMPDELSTDTDLRDRSRFP